MARFPRRLFRDTNTNILAYTGPAGEPAFNTDTNRLHMQDGTTPGGHAVRLLSDTVTADEVTLVPADSLQVGFVDDALTHLASRDVQTITRTTTAPPVSPSVNDAYLVPAASPSGAWVGHENEIAVCSDDSPVTWDFQTPTTRMRVWSDEDKSFYTWSGSAWVAVGAGIADGAVSTLKIADDAVTTAKIADDAVSPAKLVADSDAEKLAMRARIGAGPQSLTPVALSGLTGTDFTIPTGCKSFTLTYTGVSGSSTGVPYVQLGDAGGVEGFGYIGSVMLFTPTPGITIANLNSSFPIVTAAAAGNIFNGSMHFTSANGSTFKWAVTGSLGLSDTNASGSTTGNKTLSQELTTVRFAIGAGTFDAGEVNIVYDAP